MATDEFAGSGAEMQVYTPGPWNWHVHDWSMATLEGPEVMIDTVMAVCPCPACQTRAKESGEWKWGRCSVPKKADADLIAAAPELLTALSGLVKEVVALYNSVAPAAKYAGGNRFADANAVVREARAALRKAGVADNG